MKTWLKTWECWREAQVERELRIRHPALAERIYPPEKPQSMHQGIALIDADQSFEPAQFQIPLGSP